MLLPRHLTHSKEFKGSRENADFLPQLRYTVSRNLCSLVIHKLYQILGSREGKGQSCISSFSVCIRYCAKILKPPMRIVV